MDVKKKNSINTISRGKITNRVLNNSPYFNNVYIKIRSTSTPMYYIYINIYERQFTNENYYCMTISYILVIFNMTL